MDNKYRWCWCLVLLAATVIAPRAVSASEAEVHNLSNDNLYVAVVYRNWKGDIASEGWWTIEPLKEATFRADDADDMYIRITKAGQDVTFPNHQTVRNYNVHSERFNVSRVPDAPDTFVLKWGRSLEYRRIVNKGERFPEGWDSRQFFRVGSGNHHFHVRN